jgi:GH43 family beta-xylosidase
MAMLKMFSVTAEASDNGHEPGAGSGGPLRGAKGQLYEGGIRSPLIVWGPGLVEPAAAGTVNETTIVSSIDLVASLMTLSNLSPPEDYAGDGEDLLAALLGKSTAQRSGPLFWRRPPDRPGPRRNPLPDLAVRDGQWKLLCNVDGSAVQLYNLDDDIGEQNNVASRRPAIARRLQDAVLEWNSTLPADGVAPDAVGDLPPGRFVNPIAEGADPSVVKDGDRYLWCQSEGNVGVAIWESDRPTSMGRKHVIWRAPPTGPISKQVWAPELIRLDDRWHVYFAASDGRNENHLTYVLVSKTDDPLGEYTLHGPLYTGDDFDSKQTNIWAIDMDVLEHKGKRYAIWSGWSTPTSDHQYLYIAPMSIPWTLSGPRVRISSPEHPWEKSVRPINEGPQPITRNGTYLIVFSANASWTSCRTKCIHWRAVCSTRVDGSSSASATSPARRSTDRRRAITATITSVRCWSARTTLRSSISKASRSGPSTSDGSSTRH